MGNIYTGLVYCPICYQWVLVKDKLYFNNHPYGNWLNSTAGKGIFCSTSEKKIKDIQNIMDVHHA